MSSSSGRGNWRDRGGWQERGNLRGCGYWRSRRGRDGPEYPELPLGPYGATVDSIKVETLVVSEESPKISSVEYVASYNWLCDKIPTVLVPGSPPAWTPLAHKTKLNLDEDDYFRDVNSANYPNYPMEPTIRSIMALKPNWQFQTIDLVGCGRTFGNLLTFARSRAIPFRFDVDVIGDTVFFVRREKTPRELIKNIIGYGHNFVESSTTWDVDCRRSVSHQRIIRYEFGGLRLLIRTEIDGYVRDPKDPKIKSPEIKASLPDATSEVSISYSLPSTSQNLQLEKGGREVSQDQIFEIKTRHKSNILDMNEFLPILWLSQTNKFLAAYHESGCFDKADVEDVRQQVLDWQKANHVLLGRFHAILKRIVDVARDSGEQQLELSWDGQGPLLITKQAEETRRALPADLRKLWDNPSHLESSCSCVEDV